MHRRCAPLPSALKGGLTHRHGPASGGRSNDESQRGVSPSNLAALLTTPAKRETTDKPRATWNPSFGVSGDWSSALARHEFEILTSGQPSLSVVWARLTATKQLLHQRAPDLSPPVPSLRSQSIPSSGRNARRSETGSIPLHRRCAPLPSPLKGGLKHLPTNGTATPAGRATEVSQGVNPGSDLASGLAAFELLDGEVRHGGGDEDLGVASTEGQALRVERQGRSLADLAGLAIDGNRRAHTHAIGTTCTSAEAQIRMDSLTSHDPDHLPWTSLPHGETVVAWLAATSPSPVDSGSSCRLWCGCWSVR